MKIKETEIPGVLIIEPAVFSDRRGFFMETYNQKRYAAAGIDVEFVQDNCSLSVQGTLRGLHYQHPHGQAKLIQVFQGEIFDVAVDIRLGSPTFGRWKGLLLSERDNRQFLVPAGLAHGFAVLSDQVLFTYKCSDFYAPESERGIAWNDPSLNIEWPVSSPILSDRDRQLPFLKDIPKDQLPEYGGA